MRVLFLVDDPATLASRPTGALLVQESRRTHDVQIADLAAMSVDGDGATRVRCEDGSWPLAHFDAVVLRSNPAARPAPSELPTALNLLERSGVPVINSLRGLRRFATKLGLLDLPAAVRPRMLVSRDRADILAFRDSLGGTCVIKPLDGSHGVGVYLLASGDPNARALVDGLTRTGHVMVQELLTTEGEVRLFVIDGQPLEVDGAWAMLTRRPERGGFRANVCCGGTIAAVDDPAPALEVASVVGPVLAEHGIRIAAIDTLDTKVVEINVLTPGGLHDLEPLHHRPFTARAVELLLG